MSMRDRLNAAPTAADAWVTWGIGMGAMAPGIVAVALQAADAAGNDAFGTMLLRVTCAFFAGPNVLPWLPLLLAACNGG